MNVLNVNMTLDPVTGGGTAERTFQMSRVLGRIGVACTVLTINIGHVAQRQAELEGARLVVLPCWSKRFYIPRPAFNLIDKLVADADIIHIMNHWSVLNALVYTVVRRRNKPYVVCPAGALTIFGRSRTAKIIYNGIVGKRILRNAARCIAISPIEVPQMIEDGVKADRISIIPNGICYDEYQNIAEGDFRTRYSIGNAPFILYVGRLNPIKGPDLLLHAFCNVKDELEKYHLVFAGPDEGMLPALKGIADQYAVTDRVHFIGYLGGVEKVKAYQACDVLAIPSRLESMSIVVLEAGACGKPVLITDQCGFNEVESIGGGKVVTASVAGLQKGLIELLQKPDKLSQMGNSLRNYTRDHFDWGSIVHKYLELYSQLLVSSDPRSL